MARFESIKHLSDCTTVYELDLNGETINVEELIKTACGFAINKESDSISIDGMSFEICYGKIQREIPQSVLTASIDRFYESESNNWVSVDKELPKDGKSVLIKMTRDYTDEFLYDIAKYSYEDECFYSTASICSSMYEFCYGVTEWKFI